MLVSLTDEGEDRNKEVEVCQKHVVRGMENSPNYSNKKNFIESGLKLGPLVEKVNNILEKIIVLR